MNHGGKAYPYLKALLDGLIEAAPNWTKAPAEFISSLSEQLKTQSEAEVRQLEEEIKGITKDELEAMLEEAGCDQREHIELIVKTVELIPDSFNRIDYRFDRVDNALEEIANRLKLKHGKPLCFPLPPHLTNITPPEPNFVGRVEMLNAITEWYKNPDVHIGVLIGWGGEGKSSIARKWYDSLGKDDPSVSPLGKGGIEGGYSFSTSSIKPDGIFWWGFYRNAYLDRFLDSLLNYLAQGRINLNEIKSTWAKVDKINELIQEAEYLIILDGLEEMQKGEERGTEFGCMVHRELMEILTNLADSKSKGLCLITTRYPLTDIKNWEGATYAKTDVERLSPEDSRLLFERIGVKGDQEEIDGVIEEYKGHALSLTLLAKYLVEDFKGDIKRAREIPPFPSDKEAGGKAHRMLRWYAKQLSSEQLIFMKIFSLFRRAVNERDFEGVFRSEMETEINEQLRNMSLFSFKRMVDNLCDRRLITKGQDDTYTTHPLIKNYFESIFEGEDKKLCHKKIYQYIGTYAPERPETLEEMQPLFEQVYHGCAAGLYNDIYYNILSGVLLKQPQRILVNKLGAWETALSLIRVFFPRGEFSQTPLVSRGSAQSWSSNETELLCPVDYHQRSAQGWLLNEAGLALLATGRPKEAEDLFMRASKLYIEDEQIVPASICHQNLADLLFRVGELESAFSSAKKAVQMVEKAKTFWYIKNSKAYFAWILHLIGKRKEADSWFKHADELRGYRLHSISGVFYADFLLSNKRIDEAIELTKQNLEISKRHNWLNNISICYRCLGAIERTKGNYNKAGIYLQKALEISRNVGIFALEIEALIERGRLRLETKDYNGAEADSNQALKLIDRTGFKLYEPDAEVVLAKVYLAQGDKDEAKKFAQSAYDKAKNMSYYWPQKDAEEILKKINNTFSHNQ